MDDNYTPDHDVAEETVVEEATDASEDSVEASISQEPNE